MTTLLSVAHEIAALLRGQFPANLSDLAFALPEQEPDVTALNRLPADIGLPGERACCQLGGHLSPVVTLEDTRSGHSYGTSSGPLMFPNPEGVGHIYTGRGGFIDIGHTRDYIDITRWLAHVVRHAPLAGGQDVLAIEGAELRLVVPSRTAPPPPTTCALAGAQLAYQRAVWHEIATYYTDIQGAPERYSAFSPEDNFSNALGCLIGFRAVLEPGMPFDTAVDVHLTAALHELGAVDAELTEQALDYVNEFWFTTTITTAAPFGDSLRRHMDALGTIRPWLVTDTTVPGKSTVLTELRTRLGRPTSDRISIPDVTATHQPLADIAYWEFVKTPGSPLEPIFPSGPSIVRSDDLPAMIDALRAIVRAAYPEGDQRG